LGVDREDFKDVILKRRLKNQNKALTKEGHALTCLRVFALALFSSALKGRC
jgi:hypothetical protein